MPRTSRRRKEISFNLRIGPPLKAARRQSLEAAKLACDPNSDEHTVMREIEAELADESFWNG
jgi:hypothetical protein